MICRRLDLHCGRAELVEAGKSLVGCAQVVNIALEGTEQVLWNWRDSRENGLCSALAVKRSLLVGDNIARRQWEPQEDLPKGNRSMECVLKMYSGHTSVPLSLSLSLSSSPSLLFPEPN